MVKCKAKTQKGTQCSREATKHGFCAQHAKSLAKESPKAIKIAKAAPVKGKTLVKPKVSKTKVVKPKVSKTKVVKPKVSKTKKVAPDHFDLDKGRKNAPKAKGKSKANYEKIGMTTLDFINDFEYGQNTETYSPIFEIIVNDRDNYAIVKTYYVPEEDENSEEKVEVYFILSYDDKRVHALDHGFTGSKLLKEKMKEYGKSWKTIYRN